jgi:hypothetical protein
VNLLLCVNFVTFHDKRWKIYPLFQFFCPMLKRSELGSKDDMAILDLLFKKNTFIFNYNSQVDIKFYDTKNCCIVLLCIVCINYDFVIFKAFKSLEKWKKMKITSYSLLIFLKIFIFIRFISNLSKCSNNILQTLCISTHKKQH